MTLPYELRIGVTGHRDLPAAKIAEIEAAVQAVIAFIGNALRDASARPFGPHAPNRTPKERVQRRLAEVLRAVKLMKPSPQVVPLERQTPINWVVISPLAKGADRLVAEAVLKLPMKSGSQTPPSTRPPQLEVILPFPMDEYRKDFNTADDLAEFEDLLRQAGDATAITVLNEDFGETRHADPRDARNACYESVGRAVVEASEILIAVWNGRPASGRGGTAEIVRYAVDAGRCVIWIDSEYPTQPPSLLKARDGSDSAGTTGGVEDFVHEPLPVDAKRLSKAYHRLAAYQRDVLHDEVKHRTPDWIAAYETAVAGDEAGRAVFHALCRALQPSYIRTDALATLYQTHYQRAADTVYCCSVAAVAIVALQVLFFPHATWLIAFEIAAMCVAAALVMLSEGEQWKAKWQHDRHLAEWLRRLHFTLPFHRELERLRVNVIDPRPYPGAEEWFESAFRSKLTRLRRELTAPSLATLKMLVAEAWIDDQAGWHHGKAERRKHDAHRFHRAGWATFVATLIMALLHIAGVGHGDAHDPQASAGTLGQAITLLAIVLPAVGAAIHACAVLRDYDRLAARSEQLVPVLRGLADRARAANDVTELARVVAAADHVMAEENDDWWITLGGQAPVMPG